MSLPRFFLPITYGPCATSKCDFSTAPAEGVSQVGCRGLPAAATIASASCESADLAA